LTVAAAIRHALACNGEIAALRATLSVAQQRHRAASDIPDPELGLAWGEQTVDGLRNRNSTEAIHSSQTGERDSTRLQTSAENTVGPGGVPISSSTTTETTTDHGASAGRSTQTHVTTTTGFATEDTDGYRIGLRLFVPNLWQMMPRLSARRAEIQAAQADLQAAEWRVSCDVRRLFNDLAYLTADMALAADLIRLNGTILATARERVALGAATATDLMTAVRRDLQAQNDLDTLRQRHALARRDLGALLNLPLESVPLELPELKSAALPPGEIEAGPLEQLALLRRSDVEALRWRTVAARAAYREARNIRLPWIKEISGSYRASHSDSEGTDTSTGSSRTTATTRGSTTSEGQSLQTETSAGGTVRDSAETSVAQEDSISRSVETENETGSTWIHDASDSEEWQVGFAVDIPIFSWLKNHEHDVLRAECTLAEVQETGGQRLVRREVGDALGEWRESRRQQERYDRLVEPLIAEMQRTADDLEKAPGTMPDQVAAARAQVIESRRFRLGTGFRACQSLVALERVLGAPLDEALGPGAAPAAR
jgi:outer membrane protein TolC